MAIIFLAECGEQQPAELFRQHFDAVVWAMNDRNIEAKCCATISQDFEESWWCSLSVDVLDWVPANRAEQNYRRLQIIELGSVHIAKYLETAPDFRYALAGEISTQDAANLLADRDYGLAYNCLMSGFENSESGFRLPLAVTVLNVSFYLSEAVWEALRSPDKFEPSPASHYVWVPASPKMLTGGIQAPPMDVLTQQAERIVVDVEAAKVYSRRSIALCEQRRFTEALASAERAQQLDPMSPSIHQNKAACLFYLARYSDTVKHCDIATKLNPNRDMLVLIYQLKGDALFEQGHLEQALASHQNSIDLNPDEQHALHPHCQKAALLFNLKRFQAALVECDLALSLSYNHAPSQDYLYVLRQDILTHLNEGES